MELHMRRPGPAKMALAYVEPDGWPAGEVVYRDLLWADDEGGRWSLCIETQYEPPLCASLPVAVEYTGRIAHTTTFGYRRRARLTILGDCEPDQHTGAWVYFQDPAAPPRF